MAKESQLVFRIASELKQQVEAIAAKEGRSIAQIYEAFLKAGVDQYRKEGSKFIQKQLQRSSD